MTCKGFKRGWDEATLERMRATRTELDSALQGIFMPQNREDFIQRCLGRFLLAEGFALEEIWPWHYALGWWKPAMVPPTCTMPRRLLDFLTLFWMEVTS